MRRFEQEWQLLVVARKWLHDGGYRLLESRGPEGMEQGFEIYGGDQLGIGSSPTAANGSSRSIREPMA